MLRNKLVSIIIPTYKRPDSLERTLNSVLNQTYSNIEIIVVDDNNPLSNYRQEVIVVMDRYKKYNNLFYIKHDRNKNGSAARNTGFSYSKGDYIMFLDDDDEFLPEKVFSQVERLENLDDSWGACYTNYIRKKNGRTIIWGAEKREGNLLTEELMRNLFVHAGSNLMLRRKVVEEVNGFDESFIRNQDVEFLSRVLLNYKLAYVDKVGLIVHTHVQTNRLKSFNEITNDYLSKFSFQIERLPIVEKNRVYSMINLQLFRHYLFNRKFIKSVKLIKDNNISLVLVIKYLLYLINRAITKKAYGFKF